MESEQSESVGTVAGATVEDVGDFACFSMERTSPKTKSIQVFCCEVWQSGLSNSLFGEYRGVGSGLSIRYFRVF